MISNIIYDLKGSKESHDVTTLSKVFEIRGRFSSYMSTSYPFTEVFVHQTPKENHFSVIYVRIHGFMLIYKKTDLLDIIWFKASRGWSQQQIDERIFALNERHFSDLSNIILKHQILKVFDIRKAISFHKTTSIQSQKDLPFRRNLFCDLCGNF